LGLPSEPESWQPQAISRALLARLARIDEHPQSRTPEADELRVALHVAAAQLRDPAVRSQLTEPAASVGAGAEANAADDPLQAPGALEVGRSDLPAGVRVASALGSSVEPVVDDEFRIAAEHVLASCGGWNAESKRRLGYLARSADVDAGRLQQALVSITRQHEQPAQTESAPGSFGANPGAPVARASDPFVSTLSRASLSRRPLDHRVENPRARTWMTIGTVIMFGASVLIGAGLLTILVQEILASRAPIETRVVSGVGPGAAAGADAEDSENDAPADEGNRGGIATPTLIAAADAELVRYLQSLSSEAFEAAPDETVAGLLDVYDRLATVWPRLADDVRTAVPLALRDAVLAASAATGNPGTQVLEAIRADLDVFDAGPRVLDDGLLRRAVFAYGTLGLLIETPIAPRIERQLRSRLNSIASGVDGVSASGASFADRAGVALRVLAIALTPRAADSDSSAMRVAWTAWVEMSDTLSPVRAAEIQLDAIEHLSIAGESPSFHQPSREVLGLLVRSVDWSGDPGRIVSARLLEWFDDSAFPVVQLGVITGEIVDAALLPGLDASMKLSGSAGASDRMALRDRYALRMSHPQIGEGRLFASEWAGFAEELLAEGLPSEHRGALDRAVRAAALNEAASFWAGSDEQAARSALERARIGLEELTARAGGTVAFSGGGPARADGEWAAKYLRARRNADERMSLLYELENTGGPAGQADADVLAEAASYSTPMEIRRQAQGIVVAYADRPAVLIGLLEVLPRAATQDNVSGMLELVTGRSLPDADDQGWRTQARGALVARLLEQLSDPEQRFLDVAEDVLKKSIEARADLLPAGEEPGASSGLDSIEESMRTSDGGSSGPDSMASAYVDRLLRAASRYPQRAPLFATLTEIESRRVWRTRLVTSDTGRFAAETTSVLELKAYMFGSERPSDAARVNEIIAEAAASRRSAISVYQQIATNELAILRLNLMRLRGDL
jgi:hypothetical protein